MNVLFSPFSLCSGAVTFCPNGFSSKSIGAQKWCGVIICLRVHIKRRFFHFLITFSYHLIEKDAAPYDQLKYWVTVKGCSTYHSLLGPGGRSVRVKSLQIINYLILVRSKSCFIEFLRIGCLSFELKSRGTVCQTSTWLVQFLDLLFPAALETKKWMRQLKSIISFDVLASLKAGIRVWLKTNWGPEGPQSRAFDFFMNSLERSQVDPDKEREIDLVVR